MSLSIVLAALLLALTQHAIAQQLDPVRNYCFRGWHQSIVKNNILYIDGGIQGFTDVYNNGTQHGNVTIGYNLDLISIDLSQPFNLTSGDITETVVNKTTNPSSPATVPPALVSAALYQGPPGDDNIYLYGGDTSYWNVTFPGWAGPQSSKWSLFSYNPTEESRGWTAHSVADTIPWRPGSGPAAEAPELGLGFYFNGQLDSGSSTETQPFGDHVKIFLEGMVVLNLTDLTARNVSTDGVSDGNPRTRGVLQYLPEIGERGILVQIGGSYKPVTDLTSKEQDNFVDISQIGVFDVASLYSSNLSAPNASWYMQQATGDIPPARAQFCAVTAAAPDNSSYNIYINSGNNQADNVFYDDVYVLSIPSFTWTQIFSGTSPRYGHTCHRAGNRQMINVGGAIPGDFDTCDFERYGVAVMDLSAATWNASYVLDDEPYTVPTAVVDSIGGTTNGEATMTAPAGGYTHLALARLFNNAAAYVAPTSTSTSTPSGDRPSGTRKGAIIGGVIGGIVALVLLGLAVYLIMRSKRKQKRARQLELDHAAALRGAGHHDGSDMTQSPQYATDRYTNEQLEQQRLRPELSGDGEQQPWGQELEGGLAKSPWGRGQELEGETTPQLSQLPSGGAHETSELPGTQGGFFGWHRDEKAGREPVQRYELPGGNTP